MRNALSTLAAVVIATVLAPFFAYGWYFFMVMFGHLLVVGRWDEASWWKPGGYYAVGALFVGVGIFLLVADVLVGFFLRQVFMGDLIRAGRSIEKISPGARPRAW